ncbi:helix-turn-helix domain-containing protein [Devosia nitrariae]|uniref:HTH araC/xylS-type domain-containing protein n=1 Tax=Devosia nitrariae TaxID=2071872 RepID=A0ABQ5W2F8_9HYPH|nr:helix-turn-helix domain-containing protein [Devosia nitrariae]GLQ53918.1 hypothetical protein GCM10010862_11770 [Devosia nitrariae]
MSVCDPILQQWRYCRTASADATVLPDGCRDLIIRVTPDGRSSLELCALDDRTRKVHLTAGECLIGLRLRPGASVPASVLRQLRMEFATGDDHERMQMRLLDAIHTHVRLNEEPIAAILETTSVRAAARQLGVSPRTLHRYLVSATGRAPSFWFDLARARRALAGLATQADLASIAFLSGYADQAHMTRSFRHRFGHTPGRFRKNEALMRLAAHPGLSG